MARRGFADERAASELIGPVLLIGVVLTGALLVAALGASTIEDQQADQESQASGVLIQEVDSRLSTLSTSSSATTAEFTFGDKLSGTPELVTAGGYLNVTVNRNSACSVSIPLDSIRLQTETATVAYEGGGTWRQSEGNGTVMQTAPEFEYRNGSLDISVVNLTGTVHQETNVATLDSAASQSSTRVVRDTLFQGECIRPDNVTLSVRSDFHDAWSDYLAAETGLAEDTARPAGDSDHVHRPDDRTVEIHLNQSSLPQRTDDERNNVVNVTGADYMDSVTVSDDGIAIDKDASNTYSVFAEPVSEQVEIGTVRQIVEADNVTRPPLDVAFVIDESGSMGDPGPGGDIKRESAQAAMKQFTTFLDGDMDRVGLVGFEGNKVSRYFRTDDYLLTSDFETFNDSTVESTTSSGGTDTSGGMSKATSMLDLKSNETRNRIVVLLSDGVNDYEDWWVGDTYFDCDNEPGYRNYDCYGWHDLRYQRRQLYHTNAATAVMAENASRTGVETYTVGFGDRSNIDDEFLNGTAVAATASTSTPRTPRPSRTSSRPSQSASQAPNRSAATPSRRTSRPTARSARPR
ncbi:VWA domain-containing protein [Halapricum sp. CBA1109]|uniref:vWA domain-containing protein n=1 Tax=Halapricum sp. CBA1109 TaxID=2668068 RepID=UPI0012F96B97|nr:vWA domain-containing protein [Halapricum sp. CBA1109]MUV89234.1 VWA domain-containing protein [Halapricum sp. CBA1109]